jgi:hypothetical protein
MDEIDKDSLLKQLADNAYNIGFGAKKHFATYDIITKVPGGISLIGLLIGVGQLAYPHYQYSTIISTLLIMAIILALSMSPYNAEKEKYNQTMFIILFNLINYNLGNAQKKRCIVKFNYQLVSKVL